MSERKKTKVVKIGNTAIGGGNLVLIQSMTDTDTRDVEKTLQQISKLCDAGCEIVRVAVFDEECVKSLRKIKDVITIPLVADIHFDYKLAVAAVENGADKIRINPGNIGNEQNIKKVVDAAKLAGAAIRVGVNSGSVEKEIEDKYGNGAEALAKSAIQNVRIIEKFGFDSIVVSLKSSDVSECIKAYEIFSAKSDYPLHIGVTEAGDYESSIVKSSMALGSLLINGIGDTIRVSITGDPVLEIGAAKSILQYAGVRKFGIDIVSCPTCGRCRIPLKDIVKEVKAGLKGVDKPIKVAVMGCIVNGPGEAKHADVGIAGGDGRGAIFAHGELIKTVDENRLVEELLDYIKTHF
ncbi:MAG: flavodoxin-dependent (E)-4-hydroxy-3-methylbut-2-enyl-diphosphate synthase [Eubacteriales bacterium]